MKLKIVYNATKKFILNTEGDSYGSLLEQVKAFINTTYGDDMWVDK